MSKRNKIIYWISTVWLSLGMVASGIGQIIGIEDQLEIMRGLGYPDYFSPIIGVWKLLGVIAILIPRYPLVKEWAYAGFFFVMTGAFASHVFSGDEITEFFGPTLLILLTLVSWFFRPTDRKINRS